MRKFILILLLVFLWQNIVFARNAQLFPEIKLDSNNIKDNNAKIKPPSRNLIDCDKAINNGQSCKYLEISKKDFILKSNLGKNYNAYTYIIKNTTNQSIEIVKWNSFGDHINPDNIIKSNNFMELKQALQLIALTPVVDVVYVVSAVSVLPMRLMLADCENKKDRMIILTLPVSAPAIGIWYIIASPYYYASEKINDKKALQESVSLIKDYPAQRIEPFQQIKFNALVSKKGSFNRFAVYFKEINSSTVYKVSL